MKKIQMRK